MKLFALFVGSLLALPIVAVADDDVTPTFSDDVLVDDATNALEDVMASVSVADRHRLRGMYIAIDLRRAEVAALPACDDDGDYVVVLSRGFLELVAGVAYADASDRVRGTHLREAYGALLARGQLEGAPVLPPPPRLGGETLGSRVAVDAVARAFASDAMAWVVADEAAHAVNGGLLCSAPTLTHEAGDDVWTMEEEGAALQSASARMAGGSEADAWATNHLVSEGGSEVPAIELLETLGALEEARPTGGASTYLFLHPHAQARAAAITLVASAWREAHPAETSASPSGDEVKRGRGVYRMGRRPVGP